MLPKKRKILFFSAPIGAGHTRAAQAVRTAMLRQDPDAEVKIANIFDFFSPMVGQLILKIYLTILLLFPPAYGLMYRWGNKDVSASLISQIINWFLASRMHRLILEYRPDAIVCTHATPAGLAAYLAKYHGMKVPITAVITDYAVHRLWVYPEMERYFVANSSLCTVLEGYGIERSRVDSVGIPVEQAFGSTYSRERVCQQLGLAADKKTLLVMGGGAGVLPMDEIILLCNELEEPLQIMVVTGNNRVMYNKIESLKPSLKCTLRLFGYVNNIHELMGAADLLISKPGGLTASEALCAGLPILVYKPIPGQEEANTAYLINHGVAVRADSLDEIRTHLLNLLDDTDTLAYMGRQAVALGRPQAADTIAATIFSQVCS